MSAIQQMLQKQLSQSLKEIGFGVVFKHNKNNQINIEEYKSLDEDVYLDLLHIIIFKKILSKEELIEFYNKINNNFSEFIKYGILDNIDILNSSYREEKYPRMISIGKHKDGNIDGECALIGENIIITLKGLHKNIKVTYLDHFQILKGIVNAVNNNIPVEEFLKDHLSEIQRKATKDITGMVQKIYLKDSTKIVVPREFVILSFLFDIITEQGNFGLRSYNTDYTKIYMLIAKRIKNGK